MLCGLCKQSRYPIFRGSSTHSGTDGEQPLTFGRFVSARISSRRRDALARILDESLISIKNVECMLDLTWKSSYFADQQFDLRGCVLNTAIGCLVS